MDIIARSCRTNICKELFTNHMSPRFVYTAQLTVASDISPAIAGLAKFVVWDDFALNLQSVFSKGKWAADSSRMAVVSFDAINRIAEKVVLNDDVLSNTWSRVYDMEREMTKEITDTANEILRSDTAHHSALSKLTMKLDMIAAMWTDKFLEEYGWEERRETIIEKSLEEFDKLFH